MRIGIDLLPLQSSGSRDRGVGRYAAGLIEAIAASVAEDEFVLYSYDRLPFDRVPRLNKGSIRVVSIGRDEDDDSVRDRWEQLAAHNPDRLDTLLMLNPFELSPGFEPPPRVPGGVPIIAVLYDLIPMRFPESYLSDPGVKRRYHRRIDTISCYDCLLAISESTRRDAIDLLGLRSERVSSLPIAVDPRFRPAAADGSDDHADCESLARIGVSGPFILHLGGRDDRKNARGVLDGFASLEPTLREKSQLVLVGAYDDAYRDRIRSLAADRGILDWINVPDQPIDDETIAALTRRCSAFVFPSYYEGLGLPILEAMRSGAAVIAGRNSSQVDVVGDAGILVDPSDSAGITRALARLLTDPGHAKMLGRFALERASTRCQADLGHTARDAISRSILPRTPAPHLRLASDRPRIGLVSPFPPKETGIADYAERLAESISEHATVDLYHDGDYIPELGLRDRRFRCFDRAAFPRRIRALPHRALIYQMGNSWYHRSVYEVLRAHPGITVLHDFNLAGFHYWYAHQTGVPSDHFDQVFAREQAAGAIAPHETIDAWRSEPGGIQGAATRRGVFMNREIFERSRFVVVHSPYCRDLVRQSLPAFVDRTVVIPMGAAPNLRSNADRRTIRNQFGIPDDAVVFGCFGNLTKMKMYEEAIRAFATIRDRAPQAVMLFVGKDWEDGQARSLAVEGGLANRAIFLGKASKEEYGRLVAAVDVGLGLRRPPTYGETSASLLDFLRSGVATLVTDVATFRDYPAETVVRWDPELDGEAGLADLLLELATDPARRRSIAGAAIDYVRTHHDWSITARAYAELIARRLDDPASDFGDDSSLTLASRKGDR